MKTKSMAILTAMCALSLCSCGSGSNSKVDVDEMTAAEKMQMGQLVEVGESKMYNDYYYMIDTDGNPDTIEYAGCLKGESSAYRYAKARNDSKEKPRKSLEDWAKQVYRLDRVY